MEARTIQDLLGRKVVFKGPPTSARVPGYTLGRAHWVRRNNSVGIVASVLDGNSIEDERIPVLFGGHLPGRLNLPTEYLHPLERRTAKHGRPWDEPKAEDQGPRASSVAPLFLTVANQQYHHWLANLHQNLVLLNHSSSSLCVCTSDAKTKAVARAHGMGLLELESSALANASLSSSVATFGKSDAFMAVAGLKQQCIWTQLYRLPLYSSYIFLDADITLLQDPWPLLPRGIDLAIQDDSPRRAVHPQMNIGFFAIRHTPATARLGKRYQHQLELRPKENDQAVFNDLIIKEGHSIGVHVHTLDPTRFPCGVRFYEQQLSPHKLQPEQREAYCANLAALHHNWVATDALKWTRAVEWEAVLHPGDNFANFTQRFRGACLSKPRWDYKKSTKGCRVGCWPNTTDIREAKSLREALVRELVRRR